MSKMLHVLLPLPLPLPLCPSVMRYCAPQLSSSSLLSGHAHECDVADALAAVDPVLSATPTSPADDLRCMLAAASPSPSSSSSPSAPVPPPPSIAQAAGFITPWTTLQCFQLRRCAWLLAAPSSMFVLLPGANPSPSAKASRAAVFWFATNRMETGGGG